MLLAPAAGAFPIPPQTLWELTRGADRVVLARVHHIHPDRDEGDELDERYRRFRMDPGLAELEILDTWVGPAGDASVRVRYHPEWGCPAPPSYRDGERVLAFLRRGDGDGSFETVGLSYGTQYPADDELTALKERVLEAARLHALQEVPDRLRADWAVRAIADPATRWDGVLSLARLEDRDDDDPNAPRVLTAHHRRVMKQTFLDANRPVASDFQLLALLAEDDDDDLTLHALDLLVTAHRDQAGRRHPDPWLIHATDVVARRLGEPDPTRFRRKVYARQDGFFPLPDAFDARYRRLLDDEVRRLRALARRKLPSAAAKRPQAPGSFRGPRR